MFGILLVTCVALTAWSLEPKSTMAEWVSGLSAVVGLVMLACYHGRRFGFARRGSLR
jgi:flagellar biogenesis protein FliO